MSWAELDWCASLGPEVKTPLRSLLWAMAYHAHKDSGLVTAGVRTLGDEAGIGKSTVARLLVEGEKAGLLVKAREAAGSRPTWYRLACFVSHYDGTQAEPQRPASVPSGAARVPPRAGRNSNPNGETPQQRLARLAAQGDQRPGGRPPAPRPRRSPAVLTLDDPAAEAGWPPQLAASAW
jgi:hypothetical protein